MNNHKYYRDTIEKLIGNLIRVEYEVINEVFHPLIFNVGNIRTDLRRSQLQYAIICKGLDCSLCPVLLDAEGELYCRCCHNRYATELKDKLNSAICNDDSFSILCYVNLLKKKIIADYNSCRIEDGDTSECLIEE